MGNLSSRNHLGYYSARRGGCYLVRRWLPNLTLKQTDRKKQSSMNKKTKKLNELPIPPGFDNCNINIYNYSFSEAKILFSDCFMLLLHLDIVIAGKGGLSVSIQSPW